MHPRASLVLFLAVAIVNGCRRTPEIPEATQRQAVTAFHVGLAALQTSQDAHARKELERVMQLVPDEAAAWANLGLLLLRQQQTEEATQRLAKAAALAPQHAAIVRLQALAASRSGSLEESARLWRRAIELDAADLKAPFALAQELERLGGSASEAEAKQVLAALAARSSNLAAGLEYARLAAKLGDAAALNKALDALTARSSAWPDDARQRLTAVRDAARTSATLATTPVIFLKNVLIREPEYRAALAAVSTPRSEVGEPLTRLVRLRNPEPQPAAADERLTFTSDGAPAVAMSGTLWGGATWLSGDGSPTVVALGPGSVRLGTGVTTAVPASGPAGPDAVVAPDLDYDFRNDLVVATAAGLQILKQGDKGAFSNVTAAAKLPADAIGGAMHGVWSADLDTDGDLDLIAGRRDQQALALVNNGDGTFAVAAPFGAARLRGFAWADVDGEGVPDAALLDDQGTLRLFVSLRGFVFREQRLPADVPRLAVIAAADVTGDGILDVIGVAGDGAVVRVSLASSGQGFESAAVASFASTSGLAAGSARLLAADLDNNGALDLILTTSSSSLVLLGAPGRTFRALAAAPQTGGVTAAADVDGNGRLELIGHSGDGARVVRSSGQKPYHWQAIRPRAVTSTGDQRINPFGLGGEIEVRSGLHAQKQIIAAPVVHFGLGEATAAEVARIVWPNGVLQSEFDLAADTAIGASQRLKGSCPWLFAWNGREMSFVTDFIWRSPLGLRINAQATADVLMTEDWVKIRGDQLAARDGAYDLRITAELWETHFFDLVSLLAVDHPAGTEVFVDERFAIPPPRPGVILTSPVGELAAVRDDGGRDVAEVVRARDDRHLDFAGRGRYQGLTRNHYVEIELPEHAPRSGPLWLVAQGWIHPTDSSINVALGQGSHPRPDGLSLHVADADGRFVLAKSGLGFPSGKDKTVLIDLAGVFRPGAPRRVRLGTNLEIFWDRLGWASGRSDVAVAPRRIEMSSADLRYRGYSVTAQKDPGTPERPRYLLDGVAPRWRDLEGFHTRFGDVRELLQRVDDRYVIMNAGDEIRLTFPASAGPAPGMVRDFVLVGDGWVKDGDYNTTASRTVLPLPTHHSAGYVRGTGRLEDDPVYLKHRADFEHYHTRYVSPEGVRDALRAAPARSGAMGPRERRRRGVRGAKAPRNTTDR